MSRVPAVVAECDVVALKAVPTRGPVPEYDEPLRPFDTPASPEQWAEVRALREQAWNAGISEEELISMQRGVCANQMRIQSEALTHKLTSL